MVTSSLLVLWHVVVATLHQPQDTTIARIQSMVARPAAMCGEFEQQKTLVGLRRPVKSAGRFCVVSESGVLWSTHTPFASTLRLSRSEIIESQGDRVTTRLSASDEPTVAVISSMLFAVLAGDFKQLQSSFTIDASADASAWRARLLPKDAGMRRVVGTIDLSGGEYVRQITITEASGDRTVIAFTGFSTGASALRPDEARALNSSTGRAKPPTE